MSYQMTNRIKNLILRFQNQLLLIGRVLFSEIFILSGIGKIFNYQSTVEYMTQAGVPFANELLLPAIIFELGGGLMVLLGYRIRLGAFLLFLFTLTVTFAIHHFWTYPQSEAMTQMISFQKNIAFIGACLYIFVCGAGAYSLDQWLANRNLCKP